MWNRPEQVGVMEVVYVLDNTIALNRKLEAPRTARDEKRRATHNEGNVLTKLFWPFSCVKF